MLLNLRKNLTTPWSNWLRIPSAGAILYSTGRAAFLFLTACGLGGAHQALANVTVTGASGGGNISADTAANATSPAWTTLGAITIAEGANDDFAQGNGVTLVLKVPTGFEFNTAVTPDVAFTLPGNITSASVSFDDSVTMVITLDVSLLPPGAVDTLSIGSSIGIQVRPTAGTPLASGRHIYRPNGSHAGAVSITGIGNSPNGSSGSNFGSLTEVAGAANSVRVETAANGNGSVVQAQNIAAGSSITAYSITRDAFSNFKSNVAANAWFLPTKTGSVVDGDLVPAINLRSAVFTAHLKGTGTIGASSDALSQTHSGLLTVVAGSATKMFVTLPGETFIEVAGNSGTVLVQNAGTPFTITKLTAVDNFTNIAANYSGSKTISYTGPGGSPSYTTNVSFSAGQSTTTLTTTLTLPETTTITATASGLTGVPSSSLTVIASSNTPPTIEAIANQTVYVDHPALIVLTVSDAETAVTNLQLSLVTSNPALVTSENVVFHYFVFDGHWYITVVPTFGLTGTATNTVTVSDGINTASTDFVLTVTPPPPGGERFVNTNAVTIPDVGPVSPYPSTINVTGMSGTITNLTLTLSKIHHEWIKDVHMLLVSPTGQGMVVFSRISRDPVTNITATLTDASPFVLPDQFDLWSEQYKPTDLATTNGSFSDNNFPAPAPGGPYGPLSFAGSFNGLPANGTWSLYVYDDYAPDDGGIAGGWSLMIATTGGALPQLQILSLTGAGTTNVVITWSAISNLTYRVQYQSDLNDTNWFDLVPDVTATNSAATAIDNPSAANLRFYRIMLVP